MQTLITFDIPHSHMFSLLCGINAMIGVSTSKLGGPSLFLLLALNYAASLQVDLSVLWQLGLRCTILNSDLPKYYEN